MLTFVDVQTSNDSVDLASLCWIGERLLVLDAGVVQNGFCLTWRSYSRYLGDNIKLERDVLIGSWKGGMEICLDVTSTGSICHETAGS